MTLPHSELVAAGRSFVEDHANAIDRTRPAMHYISELREGRNFDGSSRHDIRRIEQHQDHHPSEAILDEPLFTTYDPEGSRTPELVGHPLVNASDCSPEMLISLGSGIIEGRYPVAEELRTTMLRRIGATLLSAATPRMLIDDIDSSIGVICKDNQMPDTYMATAELYFGSIANDKLLAFDVHDIVQHSAQLSIPEWRLAAKTISLAASEAFSKSLDHKDSDLLFARQITAFTWSVAFEESVLSKDGELHSFGCLNWLAPGDTPVDKIESIGALDNDEQRLVHRWHYLDAIKDLHRKQSQAGKTLGVDLDWMNELGYDGNKKFFELVNSPDPLPFVPLQLEDADKIEVTTPKDPKELMGNAIRLLERYCQIA